MFVYIRLTKGARCCNPLQASQTSPRSTLNGFQTHGHGSNGASPLSPRSPINANKPLPSPPLPGSEAAVGPKAKPVLKLARIMATLSDEDVERLFSGAPQYFARSEGVFTGAPHPSVAYPWDELLEIRDLTDHVQIEDEAWGCITTSPHITRGYKAKRDAGRGGHATRRRAHYYPKCRERPNMLSLQGLEKGTMGYQAALEMAVADALQEEQFGFDSLGAKAVAIVDARQRLLTSKDGLRHIEENKILEELIKNGRRYQETNARDAAHSEKLYNELFCHILHAPHRLYDREDPYSLSAQIHALLKVLATPNVWVDFSRVEWRIRLGQILWATSVEDDVSDGASIEGGVSSDERQEERYWLLLQIMLACELLIRLDAITEGEELGIESIKPSEVHRFEKDANPSVRWSLILARSWLENIEITRTEPTTHLEPEQQAKQPQKGWLATLTRRMSLSGDSSGSLHHAFRHHSELTYAVKGRYGDRQVRGLTHFARKLKWPDIDGRESRISENVRGVTDGTPLHTPLLTPTPATADTNRSSYFGGATPVAGELKRKPSRRRKIAAALHPSGWLSKSYVSGLMLPGEGTYHFLMATLLENDKEAMARLGSMANLCGGFVYMDKSFWSTACIVGRVLAAGKGAAECMGWISSDVTPEGLGEGWVNVEAQEVHADAIATGTRARLWGKAAIEKESSVLGDADPSSVLPADFIVPFENTYKERPPERIDIEFRSLNLQAPPNDSVLTTPTEEAAPTPYSTLSSKTGGPEIRTYPASITFSVATDFEYEGTEHTYQLHNDVYFVTAHPCVPSQHVKVLKSPSSPTIQQIDVTGTGLSGRSTSPVHVTGELISLGREKRPSVYSVHVLDVHANTAM